MRLFRDLKNNAFLGFLSYLNITMYLIQKVPQNISLNLDLCLTKLMKNFESVCGGRGVHERQSLSDMIFERSLSTITFITIRR